MKKWNVFEWILKFNIWLFFLITGLANHTVMVCLPSYGGLETSRQKLEAAQIFQDTFETYLYKFHMYLGDSVNACHYGMLTVLYLDHLLVWRATHILPRHHAVHMALKGPNV